MVSKKLRELREKILSLASTLDAVTEDYFGVGRKDDNKIYQNLANAWHELDAALDNLYFEIKHQEEKERERLLNWHKERGLEAVTIMVSVKTKEQEAQEPNPEPEEDRTF